MGRVSESLRGLPLGWREGEKEEGEKKEKEEGEIARWRGRKGERAQRGFYI